MDERMLYIKDRILTELCSVGALLATLATDLKTCRADLRLRLKKPNKTPSLLPLADYNGHFVDAFTHIEKAKMAVRGLTPICHQADFFKKKSEKKGHRR